MIAETKIREKPRRTDWVARVRVFHGSGRGVQSCCTRTAGSRLETVVLGHEATSVAPMDGGVWWRGGAGLLRARRRCGTARAQASAVAAGRRGRRCGGGCAQEHATVVARRLGEYGRWRSRRVRAKLRIEKKK
jgi:hypothetical protein